MEKKHPGVFLKGITKRFGDLVAVDNVSLNVEAGSFFSLLGPSGCGKTTLLRSIAGFDPPDEGVIRIGDEDVTHWPAQRRPSAMVFQNYALFPTMTVGQNVAYGLKVRKVPRSEIEKRVSESLARVDLSGLESKPVTQLSGGQQQRVALARALAVRPSVILFDEPLSNLDVALREQTRGELKLLQKELGTTSIYVTHDQQEALALSDVIAVMRTGRLQQVGSPEALYSNPETAFVAQFLGGSNIITSRRLAVLLSEQPAPDDRHVLSVRPEHIEFVERGGVGFSVKSRQFLGTTVEWWIEVDGLSMRAWLSPQTAYREGMQIRASQSRWVIADDD